MVRAAILLLSFGWMGLSRRFDITQSAVGLPSTCVLFVRVRGPSDDHRAAGGAAVAAVFWILRPFAIYKHVITYFHHSFACLCDVKLLTEIPFIHSFLRSVYSLIRTNEVKRRPLRHRQQGQSHKSRETRDARRKQETDLSSSEVVTDRQKKG